MSLAALKPAPYNPRRISPSAMAGLEASLDRFGLVQPIILNQRSGLVVGGHQRLKALKKRKIKDTPVVIVDLDESDEKALNVALNHHAISGEFTPSLQGILDEIRTADSMLFSSLLLDSLIAEGGELPPVGDPDDVPELPAVAKTKLGDLYELGDHRLYCGDVTDPASLAALLGDERVDMLLTEPPYGMDYSVGKGDFLDRIGKGNSVRRPIENDTKVCGGYRAWFGSWLQLVPFADPSTFYIFMSGLELHNLRLAFDDCGLHWGDYLIWEKNIAPLGRKDYKPRHEFIVYGWAKTHRFYGPKNATTVLEYDKPAKNDLHPTMKPAALFERLLNDGSPPGSIVFDCFGGSGTTIVACEGARRRARVMELDPIYCDVIVARWEKYCGKTARLING